MNTVLNKILGKKCNHLYLDTHRCRLAVANDGTYHCEFCGAAVSDAYQELADIIYVKKLRLSVYDAVPVPASALKRMFRSDVMEIR